MVGLPRPDGHPQDDPRRLQGQGRVLEAYLAELASRLRDELGGSLVAVVIGGSVALGAYEPGVSDVDVIAVSEGRLDPGRARRIAAALSQRSLPCPARRLELVVMTRAAAAGEPGEPAFELNLNTGKGEEDHAGVDPAAEPAHWFVVDRSIARARGRSLHGPAPREVLAGVARAQMLDALRRSLDWHEAHRPRSPDSVLNACRAWRWARTGHWTAKASAADWACGRMSDPAVVRAALAARAAGRRLPARDVSSFLDAVNSALGAARG